MKRAVTLLLAAASVVWIAAAAPAATSRESFGFSPGELVPPVEFVDAEGRADRVGPARDRLGTVFITLDRECPVSQRYMSRILEISRSYPGRYQFVLLDVTPGPVDDSWLRKHKRPGIRWVHDAKLVVGSALHAVSTAEAFVVDSTGTLRYRGAIDDQYGLSHQRPAVTAPYLRSALEAIGRGAEPPVRRTEASGCSLSPAPSPVAQRDVTYHNRVSRIIQQHCQVCHRKNGLGPMPLETYDQVYARRAIIDVMVSSHRMPPWSAKRGVGEWANDRSLSEADERALRGWIANGAPEGKASDAPVPRRFTEGWNIGKPDFITRIPEPFRVPAQGTVDYKFVYTKTNFAEDKWVTAVEIKPTQPKVVHHVIALIEAPDAKNKQHTSSGFFAITVPGSLGLVFPEGTGKKLPKGAWLKFEVHYQPNGQEVVDRTEIGFKFSSKPLREIRTLSAANGDFTIPPFNPDFQVKAEYHFDRAGQLISLFPHMHLRGKAFRYELRTPDKKVTPLLDVPAFDFNWQSYYEFRTPFDVPAGSDLVAIARYDNSKANPWNPDPSKAVRWGPQTFEEMMIGYFDFLEGKR